MSFFEVSIVAILLAGAFNFVLGGLWYSPLLFAKPWMKGMGKKKEDFSGEGAMVGYVLTLLGSFLTAYVLSLFIQLVDPVTLMDGAIIGFLAGLGIAAMRELSPSIFEGRARVLFLISASYHVVALTVMGVIIAAFA